MNPYFNSIRMLYNCFKITGMVRLKQFVYGILFGVLRCSTFFMLPSFVKLTTVIGFTQLGGLGQMEVDAMGAIWGN